MEKQKLIDLLKSELSDNSAEFAKQSAYLTDRTGNLSIEDINKISNENADEPIPLSMNELHDMTKLSKHRVANGYTFLTSGDIKINSGHAQFSC